MGYRCLILDNNIIDPLLRLKMDLKPFEDGLYCFSCILHVFIGE